MGEKGISAEQPTTVGAVFREAVRRIPDNDALRYEEEGEWKAISYKQYYDLCVKAAKSFVKVRPFLCLRKIGLMLI